MKILFLDSSNIVLETLEMLMKNFKDTFDTSFYSDPVEIIKLIETDNLEFDIFFSEILFNNYDGINLIKAIKTDEYLKNRRVAIITKEHEQNSLNALLNLGIEDIYTKSLRSQHLENFLNEVITKEMRVA